MQILSTKLIVPSVRSRVVLRSRLLQKLNQGLGCGFVLLSAPAGYGKSTLLSSWLSRIEYPFAWISLDERDNDPSRFLTYLIAAFRSIDPSIHETVDSVPNPETPAELDALLTPLVNHLAQLGDAFCLVLDDYHVIQNQVVHQVVSYLLEHRPGPLHLVIATRADPPLPLAKLRSRSDMLELRLADLRFTTQEAADFLNQTMGLKVSSEDVSRITKRTEGWIAGLQMAALSMQNSDDISGFISAISGNHHYIFDYLLDEVLAKQSPEIQSFLLYTSVLDQLSAPLCDALLDGESISNRPSSVILEELEHANLFIAPLDHEQRWYRYHPLFAELLRGYLLKSDPGRIPMLQTKASAWLEEQGLIADAIRYSFAAGDWERIARLISINIFALLEQNELNSVARQLENLTSENNPARPWLLIGRAWLAAYTGQLSVAESVLKLAETQIDSLKSELELQTLGGHIAAIRAYTSWIADKREVAAEAAKAALEWLPPDETTIRCQAATLLGLAHRELFGSTRAFELALGYARKSSISHVTIFAYGCWAWMLAMKGRLHEAVVICHEAIQLAQSKASGRPLPTLSHVYSTLSFLLYEWNDLEGALHYSKEAVILARHWEQADALHFTLDQFGAVLFARGEVDQAYDLLSQAWQVAQRTSRWFEELTISREVEWYLAQQNLEAALTRLRQAQVDLEAYSALPLEAQKSQVISFALVDVFLAQKQFSKALALASYLAQDQEKKNIGYYLLRALIAQALAHHGLRQASQSQAYLKRALTLAAPEGYIRMFLRWGEALIPLLRQSRTAGITPEYVDQLLAAFERGKKRQVVNSIAPSGLVETLSSREMDVLKLLAEGCTDKKIAESLVIARDTVHKHLKNIYGKLDVHSRTEAIARARELSLL